MLSRICVLFALIFLLAAPIHLFAEENVNEHDLAKALKSRIPKKKWQSEINIFGGDYIGDEWLNTWDVGGKYFLHLNNTFALGPSYLYSPIRASSGSTFGQGLKTKNTHQVNAEMMISNDTVMRMGDDILECDLFLTLGTGAMYINEGWEPLGVLGGGLKIYTPVDFFAVRFDVNGYFHPTPEPPGSTFNSDVAMNLGVSFIFPTNKSESN